MSEKAKEASSAPSQAHVGADKPPRSAEDFEHVLRRLISERDRAQSEVSVTERLLA